MSDSLQPHGLQPTRLLCPWDFPGKNTGVGCHFLLQCMKVKSESEVTQSCLTLCNPMDCSLPGSSAHGIFQARVLEWVAIAFSASGPYKMLFDLIHVSQGFPHRLVDKEPTCNAGVAAAAKSLQSCDPIDRSSPGSPVPEILQARTLEWVAVSFSNA